MGMARAAWAFLRAAVLAAFAGCCAAAGTGFALASFWTVALGRGSPDPMDPLGFALGAFGWLLAWGAMRLGKGRPGAAWVRWVPVAMALAVAAFLAFAQAVGGIMMRA